MKWIILLGAVSSLFSSTLNARNFTHQVARQELIQHGKKVYRQRCIGCHGEKGDGKGTAAGFLNPRPRDFTSGVFKFRSTPLDTLPTDEDLMRTLNQGVLGTSMPSFTLMPRVSKLAVIEYIKSFSDTWMDSSKKAASIVGSTMPREDFLVHSRFIQRAQRGRELFKESCVECHGLAGHGDGELGADLEDDWGEKILPANLTKTHIKSGQSVEDIYRVLMTGIGGTPMPSFNEDYKPGQLWDLAAYILYLRGQKAGLYTQAPIAPIRAEEIE